MTNLTVSGELNNAWATYVLANYPDPTTLANSIDLVKWAKKPTDDAIAQLVVDVFLGVRGINSIGWNVAMSDSQKKALYDELKTVFGDASGRLAAISSALNTYYGTLP